MPAKRDLWLACCIDRYHSDFDLPYHSKLASDQAKAGSREMRTIHLSAQATGVWRLSTSTVSDKFLNSQES